MNLRLAFLLFLSLLTCVTLAVYCLPVPHPVELDPGLGKPQELFAKIPQIKQRQKVLGYQREKFGNGWGPSTTMYGCTARQSALIAQLPDPLDKTCEHPHGSITDPYSNSLLTLNQQDQLVEIDHVFPLAAAWDMGAWSWSLTTRLKFANDPLNLVATRKELNRKKSDKLPSEWMPPQREVSCWYSQRLAAVALKYQLTLAQADLQKMERACRLDIRGSSWLGWFDD